MEESVLIPFFLFAALPDQSRSPPDTNYVNKSQPGQTLTFTESLPVQGGGGMADILL